MNCRLSQYVTKKNPDAFGIWAPNHKTTLFALRSLMPSDVVRRGIAGANLQRGFVRKVHVSFVKASIVALLIFVKTRLTDHTRLDPFSIWPQVRADVQICDTSITIPNIKAEELKAMQQFEVDTDVALGSWLGQVS